MPKTLAYRCLLWGQREKAMNHKQKFGYTVLGAVIMAVGITIGQFVTPNIEAQRNNVFDKIICREIEVVDKDGNKAIALFSDADTNRVIVYNPQGKRGIKFESGGWGNYVIVFEKQDNEKEGVSLAGTSEENYVIVRNIRSSERAAAKLISKEDISSVEVLDKGGNPVAWLARLAPSHPHYDLDGANSVGVIDNTRRITRLGD